MCLRLTMKNRYPLPLIKALPSWLKSQFWQEVCFLGYVVSRHVVLTFKYSSNFYRRFIQDFSRIAASLTLMLKTSGSTDSTIRPGKGRVGVSGDGGDNGSLDNGATSSSSSTNSSTSATQIMVEYDGVDGGGGKWVEKSSKIRKIVKKSKNLKGLKSCKGYWLRRTFTEAPIFCWFMDTKNLSSR